MLIVLLGGARSGKSTHAVRLAEAHSDNPVLIATAEARDPEMVARIARHRAERSPGWETREEPVRLQAALERAPGDGCLVIDCLALWVSNVLEQGWDDERVMDETRSTSAAAAARRGLTIVVGNEVGSGIVPADALSRRYRDLLGWVNSIWSSAADRSWLMVAGRAIELQDAAEALDV